MALIDFDAVAHHPQIQLLKTSFPLALEFLHPLLVFGSIGHINNNLYQIIAINCPVVSPMSFNLLSLVTCRAEVFDDLKDGLGNPTGRNIPSIIELERQQHLESRKN